MSNMTKADAQAFIEQAQKTFITLRNKQVDTARKLQMAKSNRNFHERDRKRAELTKQEIENVPAGTPLYKTVGKMFLSTSAEQVLSTLKTEIQTHKQDVEALDKKSAFLERELQETTRNLKELSQAMPTQ